MQVINYKIEVDNKIDFIKQCIRLYCFNKVISISENSLTILAYLIAYGARKKTIELIKSSNFVKHEGTVDNIISSLRKKGLLIKEDIGPDSFPEGLNFNPNEPQIGYIIKIKNTI